MSRSVNEWIGATPDTQVPPRVHDLRGQRFGYLTVMSFAGRAKNGRTLVSAWLCKCQCGNTRVAPCVELKRSRITSCGCKNPNAFQDLTGQTFGKWLVLRQASKGAGRRSRWTCVCACGQEKIVQAVHLKSGKSASCGCDRPKGVNSPTYKHGSDPDLYGVWCNIIQRCENSNNPAYENYGGRGISICKKWRNDFGAFAADMGSRPSKKHSIDRIDNNGNYEPANCRWATQRQQMLNTRRVVMIEYKGKIMPLSLAADLEGVSYHTAKWKFRNQRIST